MVQQPPPAAPGRDYPRPCAHPILYESDLQSLGATDEDVDVGPVPQGEYWRIEHAATEDLTTASTEVRIGIVRSSVFVPLQEQEAPSAARLYWADRPIHLSTGDRLRARWTGTTSGDRLRLYVNGVSMLAGGA